MRMNKMLSIITATTLVTGFVVSLTASAIVNPIVPGKDPNGDGRLTLADSTFIQTVLAGRYNPADLTELDVDDNGVVSMADSKYVIMDYAGAFDDEPMNIENPVLPTVNPGDGRFYYVFNAQTGERLNNRTYFISKDLTSQQSPLQTHLQQETQSQQETQAQTRQVIGTDERVEDWSNKEVVKIKLLGGFGSGFVIGPHTIATAAHMLYDTVYNAGKKIDDILLFDGGNITHLTPVEYHVPYNYMGLVQHYPDCDYGLITVEEDLTNHPQFKLGYLTDSADDNNVVVTTVGFPGTVGRQTKNDNENLHHEYLSNGAITSLEDPDFFEYTADTSGGNSGGVIYYKEYIDGVEYKTAIGIHSGYEGLSNSNCGLKFTPEIVNFLNLNTHLDYSYPPRTE